MGENHVRLQALHMCRFYLCAALVFLIGTVRLKVFQVYCFVLLSFWWLISVVKWIKLRRSMVMSIHMFIFMLVFMVVLMLICTLAHASADAHVRTHIYTKADGQRRSYFQHSSSSTTGAGSQE